MSLIFAWLVGIFLAFFPLVMSTYYKTSTGIVITNCLLCIFGFFTAGITTLVAFIVAAVSIGGMNTLKSVMFAIFLIVLSGIFMAAELTAFATLFATTLS